MKWRVYRKKQPIRGWSVSGPVTPLDAVFALLEHLHLDPEEADSWTAEPVGLRTVVRPGPDGR